MSSKKLRDFEPGHGFSKEDWDAVSDNPELTDAELAGMKPFAEVFPDLAASIERARAERDDARTEVVSLEIDRETLAAYRSTGPGWRSRMNEVLRQGLPPSQRKRAGS